MTVNDDTAVNPALMGVKDLIAQMADTLPIAYISSIDNEGYPCTKAMLAPRKREGIKVFYFTTNTFSLRVAHHHPGAGGKGITSNLSVSHQEEKGDQKRLKNYQCDPVHNFVVHNFVD